MKKSKSAEEVLTSPELIFQDISGELVNPIYCRLF